MDTRRWTPILPGSWRDSIEYEDTIDEKIADLFNQVANGKIFRGPENFQPAHPVTPGERGNCSSIVEDRSASPCSPYDEESIHSDDFYSIISQGDDIDESFLQHSSPAFSEKGKGKLTLPSLSPAAKGHPSAISSYFNDASHKEPVDVTFTNNVPSETSVDQTVHLPADSEQFILDADNSSLKSSELSRMLDANEASLSSRTSSLHSDSSSGRSMRFRKHESDNDSVYSVFSEANRTHNFSVGSRLGFSNANTSFSKESVPRSPISSRFTNGRQIFPGRIGDPEDINTHIANQFSNLNLSHPDGNSPWTLSLDPAVSVDETTPSQSSRSSLSTESFGADSRPRNPQPFPSFPRSLPSRQHSLSTAGRRVGSSIRDGDNTTRRTSNDSVYAFSSNHGLSSREMPPSLPSMTSGHENSHKSKNVIQKTKALAIKFKKLITIRKPPKDANAKVLMPEPFRVRSMGQPTSWTDMTVPALQYLDPTLHVPSLPVLPSTQPWSFDRLRPFQRTRKISSPSDNGARNEGSTEQNAYESYTRPKALEEIKASRRFSLPVFRVAPSQNHSSALFSHVGQRQRTRSVLSSRHEGGDANLV